MVLVRGKKSTLKCLGLGRSRSGDLFYSVTLPGLKEIGVSKGTPGKMLFND